MYEHGLYSLYSASTDTTRNDSVVVNMREIGENFKQNKGATNTPLTTYTAADTQHLYTRVELPSEVEAAEQSGTMEGGRGGVVAVYDFHFRRVEPYDINSLRWRAAILPPSQFDQCWTRADWKKRKSAIPAATGAAGAQ